MKPDKDSFFMGFILGAIITATLIWICVNIWVFSSFRKGLEEAYTKGRTETILQYLEGKR